MKKAFTVLISAALVLSGCGNWSNLAKGTAIGSGSGAALGAGVGALIGKDGKGTAIGAAIGTAVGAGVGAIIGNKMDKKAEELAALESANVEVVTDSNDFKAIKVTFDSGILFDLNSATLNTASKTSLSKFAKEMSDLPETNLTILGHTDNTGTAAVNEKLSLERAQAVADYLNTCQMSKDRMTVEGRSFNEPVADNATAEGRKQNRRVEVYITANEKMIEEAAAEAAN